MLLPKSISMGSALTIYMSSWDGLYVSHTMHNSIQLRMVFSWSILGYNSYTAKFHFCFPVLVTIYTTDVTPRCSLTLDTACFCSTILLWGL